MKKLTTIGFALALALSLSVGCSDDGDTGNDDIDAAVPDVDAPMEDPFVFADNAPGDYTRVDRMGMPAIATAVITSKDDYDNANPADEVDIATNPFVPEILNALDGLHTALDTQLTGLGLTPCTVVGDGTGSCAVVAVPLVIPDVLRIDPGMPAGFPNGRGLADQAMDITLAVVLLEIADMTHTPADLANLPLNPDANDVAFGTEFPYLAPAH